MRHLLAGVSRFRRNIFQPQREFYERLAREQRPTAMFITCSDARVDPHTLTQSQPGELFVLRNAGNVVPTYGTMAGGEAATIEFAVGVLGVVDIIVCGHSDCGAVKTALAPKPPESLPCLRAWLSHFDDARRIAQRCSHEGRGDDMIDAAIEENVLVQLSRLQTFPSVAAAQRAGRLALHGWVYDIGGGQVRVFDHRLHRFATTSPTLPGVSTEGGAPCGA